jgi:endonuclease/exonuclease/phosphatase family metal-dependent hydrolase
MRMLPSSMTHFRSLALCRALALGALLFSTGPAAVSAAGTDEIVLYAARASVVKGAWSVVTDGTAAGGARMANPDAGIAKITTASAAPASYFELSFAAEAGRAYHLWIRGKAQNDSWQNDSVYVQFSGSVTTSGSPIYRIGTTSAGVFSLEEDSGRGVSGWGWQDHGYGLNVLGPAIYFDGSLQTIRVQAREDGLSIDQIVLSAVQYASAAPGAGRNDTVILPETSTTTATTTPSTPAVPAGAVTWTGVVNATAAGATVQKVSGCGTCADAGAVSTAAATAVSFTVPTNHRLVVGLGRDTSSNTTFRIDYAFSFTGATAWEIRENGTYRTEGTFSSSDVFRVAVENGTVRYYRNGAVVHTSGAAVTTPLVIDTSFESLGAAVQVVGATTTSAPAPAPAPPTSGAELRVLQWNIHHGGYGTDGVYSTDRVATWVTRMNPDVVMFNEIEKYTSWGNQDQPEVYKNLLQQKTGKAWYYVFAQEYGQWSSNGKGNLILSTYPINISDRYELVRNADRSIAMAAITVNSRDITLINTHLDPYDQALRLVQATEVTGWSAVQPENRIVTGDMNAWPNQTSIAHFTTTYYDSWAVAAAQGTATAFAGNNGETKNGRIDYIFHSKQSGNLTVKSSQVYDTRDANGVMPSDHRPVLTTFIVK